MADTATAPNYLNPGIAPNLPRVRIPLIDATEETVAPFGCLVDDPEEVTVEIRRWPAQGRRPVDPDTGDEAGTTEGVFHSEWRGDILYGRNDAVGGHYVIGYGRDPAIACEGEATTPERILLWHANYHPDGGQVFFPLDHVPYVVPVALPGDDVTPSDFVCLRFDGSRGLYIHPDIWHEGVFTLGRSQRFFDRQGAVHARVSVDFPREFGCLVEVVLDP